MSSQAQAEAVGRAVAAVARSPEGQDEEARQQARAEELTLLGSD